VNGSFYLAIIENPKASVWLKNQQWLGVNNIDKIRKRII